MFYRSVRNGGEDYPIAVNLAGYGAPTVEGVAGMFYVDLDSEDIYKCLGGTDWVKIQFSAIYIGAIPPEDTKYILWIDTSVVPSPIKYKNESGVWVKTSGGSGSGESGSAEIPTVDLVALGLPVIDVEGEAVTLETDTTEIRAALEAGAVRFTANISYRGLEFNGATFTMHDIAGGLCSYAFDALGGMPMMLNLTFKEGSISANCTLLATGNGEGGDTPTEDIPTFDLANLGLPAVPTDGTSVGAQMDTAQITAALDKGPVKFAVKFLFSGMEMPAEVIMSKVSADALGTYICAYTLDFDGLPMIFNLIIQEGIVGAYYTSLTKASVPATSIDLSGLDTTGQIVETYADGSTKTTTIESDANGNPVKITDADGNVTTLTW